MFCGTLYSFWRQERDTFSVDDVISPRSHEPSVWHGTDGWNGVGILTDVRSHWKNEASWIMRCYANKTNLCCSATLYLMHFWKNGNNNSSLFDWGQVVDSNSTSTNLLHLQVLQIDALKSYTILFSHYSLLLEVGKECISMKSTPCTSMYYVLHIFF